jgi:hypothetical protein
MTLLIVILCSSVSASATTLITLRVQKRRAARRLLVFHQAPCPGHEPGSRASMLATCPLTALGHERLWDGG